MTHWDRARHFTRGEFLCPCCGRERMDPRFVEMLDTARFISGTGFPVNSGWRCEGHNLDIGGALRSAHVTGHAADIATPSAVRRWAIVGAAIRVGVRRIGIYRTHTHLDSSPELPGPRIFLKE